MDEIKFEGTLMIHGKPAIIIPKTILIEEEPELPPPTETTE